MECQEMPETKTLSAELELLKSIDPKKIKTSQRYSHFGRIAELEARMAVAEKLERMRKAKQTTIVPSWHH